MPFKDFCLKFFDHANKKKVTDMSDPFHSLYEQVRKYLKQHRSTLAHVFGIEAYMYN